MAYTLLRGEFVIRNPAANPGQGLQPDGDTIRFKAEDRNLLKTIPKRSGPPLQPKPGGINVRLEAIDALETHFQGWHQEEKGGLAARDKLLAGLGFTNVKFDPHHPNEVASADADSMPGYVLANGIDKYERLIGFIYQGDDPSLGVSGSKIDIDVRGLDKSVNAALLSGGYVYPAYYDSLLPELREHLATKSEAAREAKKGLYPRSTADKNGRANLGGNSNEINPDIVQNLVMWPKLFRRVVSWLEKGNTDFNGFDSWLKTNGNDEITLVATEEILQFNKVVKASGTSIQLLNFPEEFIVTET